MDLIERENFDVVCLQEVIPYFVGLIAKRPNIVKNYTISDLTGRTVNPYGVLSLARNDLNPTFQWHELPTRMCRQLLVTSVKLGDIE